MPRVYVRKFDWDEARRLRSEGMTYQDIAERFGVSDMAVYLACNEDARTAQNQRSSGWQKSGICPVCGGRASRNAATGQHRCRSCASKAAATSVRETTLLCKKCRQWKPDVDFHLKRSNAHRRERHCYCRSCTTIEKRRWRERNRVPCSHSCGTLVDAKNRRDPDKPYECRSCAADRIHAERRARGRMTPPTKSSMNEAR